MSDELDIFNLGIDDVKSPEAEKSKGSDIYKPDPKQSKDSIYRAILRLIPNIKDVKKSSIRKYSYWLEDETGSGFYVDCPSSVPGEKSIIQDTFWKLYKSDSAFDKKQAEKLKRKEYHYMYVFVVKDPQRPELENTIQIARFPRAVKKLIDSQLEPSAEDIEMGIEPTNIYDFFEGKDFALKVTLKGGYWNYDESKFLEKSTPISINGVKMENNEEGRKMILDLYSGISEDLSIHEFKPWDNDMKARVYKFISDLTGENPGSAYDKVTNTKPTTSTKDEPVDKITESTSDESSNDSGGDEEIESWLKEFDV